MRSAKPTLRSKVLNSLRMKCGALPLHPIKIGVMKMGRFSVPSSPARNVVKIETFKGVDLNSSPSNVEITRSPNAPNMMRDVPGKVRKRQGYERIAQFSGKRI